MGSESSKTEAQATIHRTAIVFGGTGSTGRAVAVQLASAGVSVTIVGRNEKAAGGILEEMRAVGPEGASYCFVASDLSRLRNGRDATRGLPPAVDFVVFCQKAASHVDTVVTKQYVGDVVALEYFGRIDLVKRLLPRLEAATAPRVLNVLGTTPLDQNNTNLESDKLSKAVDVAAYCTDLAFDHLAKKHPKITFVHTVPEDMAAISADLLIPTPTPSQDGENVPFVWADIHKSVVH